MGKIIQIRKIGDPLLNQKSRTVENIGKEEREIIEDLIETLNYSGGYGIAAPQIGISQRIIVIQVKQEKCHDKDCEEIPTTILINPQWSNIGEEQTVEYEGCLSVPEIRGKVKRYKTIQVTYQNEKGEKIQEIKSGFSARLIQHEIDHLEGITFLEKVESPHGFATRDMLEKYELRKKG